VAGEGARYGVEMSIFLTDPGAVYEKAAEISERALVVDPDTGYSLTDIHEDESTLAGLFLELLTAQMLVEGTLTGCVAAFGQFRSAPALVSNIVGIPSAPEGVHIDDDQFRTAVDWFQKSLANGLDDAARSALVAPVIYQEGDLTRRTGYVLALMVVADAVCKQARTQPS